VPTGPALDADRSSVHGEQFAEDGLSAEFAQVEAGGQVAVGIGELAAGARARAPAALRPARGVALPLSAWPGDRAACCGGTGAARCAQPHHRTRVRRGRRPARLTDPMRFACLPWYWSCRERALRMLAESAHVRGARPRARKVDWLRGRPRHDGWGERSGEEGAAIPALGVGDSGEDVQVAAAEGLDVVDEGFVDQAGVDGLELALHVLLVAGEDVAGPGCCRSGPGRVVVEGAAQQSLVGGLGARG
jgi:hypothetical protein